MKRWLYANRTVVGDPEQLKQRLCAKVRDLLRDATGTTDDDVAGDGSFLLRLPARLTGLDLAKTVRVATGVATETDRIEDRLTLPLHWQADRARHAFPTFEGAIELAPLSRASAELVLVGTYTPPLGPLGAAVDAAVLHGLAERTVQRLTAALARALHEAVMTTESAVEPDEVLTPAAPMQVREVMTPDPLVVQADLPVRTAALLLRHWDVHGAPVVDHDGGLIGVLSEADLLEKEAAPRYGFGRGVDASWQRREARTAGEACTRPARVTAPEATLHDAARVMLDARIGRLVVVDRSQVAGIVSRSDILRALLRSDLELQVAVDAVLDDADEPEVEATVEWGGVSVTGVASLRSRAEAIVDRIRQIDGVTRVDLEASWREDDTWVPVQPPM